MKLIKYILSLLFVLLGLFNRLEAKVILVENEKIESFSEQSYSLNNGWKVKDKPSTFFPKRWTKDKIQVEIANAFKNKVSKGGNKYEGFTTGGQKIVVYVDDAGNLKSAFPEL